MLGILPRTSGAIEPRCALNRLSTFRRFLAVDEIPNRSGLQGDEENTIDGKQAAWFRLGAHGMSGDHALSMHCHICQWLGSRPHGFLRFQRCRDRSRGVKPIAQQLFGYRVCSHFETLCGRVAALRRTTKRLEFGRHPNTTSRSLESPAPVWRGLFWHDYPKRFWRHVWRGELE